MGDIHGANKALLQCLERSAFNYQDDVLIFLGDVTDGWPETKESINTLLQIRQLVYILGNHDWWTLQWMEREIADEMWLHQGGQATVNSYRDGVPAEHLMLLRNANPFYKFDNKVFVHAGFVPAHSLEAQALETFLWDRSLAKAAFSNYHQNLNVKLTHFDEVFLGHTPIGDSPIHSGDVWLMDTGAGWSGRLSMMDLETKIIFQSDDVPLLYPGSTGRSKKR